MSLIEKAKRRAAAITGNRHRAPLPRFAPIPKQREAFSQPEPPKPKKKRLPRFTYHAKVRWAQRFAGQSMRDEFRQVIPFGDFASGRMLLSPCGAVFVQANCGRIVTVLTAEMALDNIINGMQRNKETT